MKARILTLNSDEHQVAQELLPWFVNGTLDAIEASQVLRHMAGCNLCRADAATQAELKGLSTEGAPGGDVDRDWSALRSRLDHDSAPLRAQAAMARPWWWQGLRLAMAVQVSVTIVIAIALVSALPGGESYRALGAAPVVAEPNALVVFRADATTTQMSAALHAAGARIVGGPTVTDAYLLRLPTVSPAALASIRAQPGVLSVESLQGENPK